MKINSSLYNFLLIGLLLIFVIFASLVSFLNRIENDAGLHALVSREIFEKGKVINLTSYLLSDADVNFPLSYPPIFHLTGSLLYAFIADHSFRVLPVLYGGLSLLFLSLILKNLAKNYLAIILGIFILTFNPYFIDYSSKFFMEIGLVFGVFVSLFYTLKFSESKNLSDFYIASIFFGNSVSIKQQGLFVLPIFIFSILYCLKNKKSFKVIFISLFLFFLFSAGPVFHLFKTTGSVIYPGDNPPKLIQIIEKPLRAFFDIELLEGDRNWSTLNEGRRSDELIQWRDFSNIISAWLVQNEASVLPWVSLTATVVLVLIISVAKYGSFKELIILLFISLFYFLLYYLARPRYALPLIVLPSIIVFYLIKILYSFSHRKFTLFLISSLIIINIGVNFAETYLNILNRDNYGYLGKYIENRSAALDDLYNPIKSDHDFSFVTLSPLPYETAYYTRHITVWANPYGSSELFKVLLQDNEFVALGVLKKYRAKYIVIYNDRFINYSNWAGVIPTNGFLKSIDKSPNFELIKVNDVGKVYLLKS